MTTKEALKAWQALVLAQLGLFPQALREGETMEPFQPSALWDPDWRVRMTAVQAVGRVEGEGVDVASLLIHVLQQETNEDVRAIAAQVCGERAEAVFLSALLAAAQDRSWKVRAAAIQALRNIPCQVPVNAVVVTLDDPDSTVRIEALKLLAVVLGREARHRLAMIAWRDHDEVVREEARAELRTFGSTSPLERLMRALEEDCLWDE